MCDGDHDLLECVPEPDEHGLQAMCDGDHDPDTIGSGGRVTSVNAAHNGTYVRLITASEVVHNAGYALLSRDSDLPDSRIARSLCDRPGQHASSGVSSVLSGS